MQMDIHSPEILHAGELFSRIKEFRINMLASQDERVETAFIRMNTDNRERSEREKWLLVSSARESDMIGNIAGIESNHDREMALQIPKYLLPTEKPMDADIVREVLDSAAAAEANQEKPTVEEQLIHAARQQVLQSYPENDNIKQIVANELDIDKDQFAMTA